MHAFEGQILLSSRDPVRPGAHEHQQVKPNAATSASTLARQLANPLPLASTAVAKKVIRSTQAKEQGADRNERRRGHRKTANDGVVSKFLNAASGRHQANEAVAAAP